ncbi:MAG TPA: porin family protein [Chitinophagaceae bacterium]|jgi:hypothetical protein|nr:porin family protein [Chitinophagaceae bacterium]
MKKTILLLSISLFALMAVNAQHRFIITPGLNIAKSDISPVGDGSDLKSKIGFDGGIGAEFSFSKYFSIQPEVNFSMQGVKGEGNGSETIISLNYITVPVLAKVKPAPGFSILAGPQIGFLTSANSKITNEPKQDLKDLLKSTDIFGVFGIEYQFPIGVFVGVRYQLGFTDIIDEEIGTELKNRSFTFRAGYSFPLGGAVKKK